MTGDTSKSQLMHACETSKIFTLEAFFEILKNIQEGILVLDTKNPEDIQPIFVNDTFNALLESWIAHQENCTTPSLYIQKNILPLVLSNLKRALSCHSDIIQSLNIKTKDKHDSLLCRIIPIKKHLSPIQETVLLFYRHQETEHHAQGLSSQEATIGRFVSSITHDFNNILVIISAYIDILKLKLENHHDLYTYLEIIKNAGTKANSLVEQLINFCNDTIDTKKIFNLKDSILEIKNILEYTLSKDAIIHIETDLKDAFIEANPCEIEQILTNLCLNAQQAMPQGGALKISLEPDPQSPYVCLKVEDEGRGIPEKIKEHLFEASVTTKLQKKRHGFGLLNIAAIIKKLEGFIEVESTIGKGTTFKLFFKQALTQHLEAKMLQDASITTDKKINILLIEKNETEHTQLSDLLNAAGYHVILFPKNASVPIPEKDRTVDIILLGNNYEILNIDHAIIHCIETWIQKNPQTKIISLSKTGKLEQLLKDRYQSRLFCFPNLTQLNQLFKAIPPILTIDSVPLG